MRMAGEFHYNQHIIIYKASELMTRGNQTVCSNLAISLAACPDRHKAKCGAEMSPQVVAPALDPPASEWAIFCKWTKMSTLVIPTFCGRNTLFIDSHCSGPSPTISMWKLKGLCYVWLGAGAGGPCIKSKVTLETDNKHWQGDSLAVDSYPEMGVGKMIIWPSFAAQRHVPGFGKIITG